MIPGGPGVEWFLASRLLQGVAESVEPVIVAMARDYASEAKQRLKLIGALESRHSWSVK